jgi:hypothetical protein
MGSPEAGAACPDCLERRILSDFTGSGLSFVHGLSDSPLPFASSAVVQVRLRFISTFLGVTDGRKTVSAFLFSSSDVLVGERN